MGFFDQVDADVAPAGDGQVALTFRVKERPLVRGGQGRGHRQGRSSEEVEGALSPPAHHPRPREGARRASRPRRSSTTRRATSTPTITYTTTAGRRERGRRRLHGRREGAVRIDEIDFEGNEAFSATGSSAASCRRRRSGSSRFITGAGKLNKDVLKTDVERLTAWYYDHGYVTVRVDEPRVERRDDGLYVTIKIDEGEQFKVGKVDVAGTDAAGRPRGRSARASPPSAARSSAPARCATTSQKLTERLSRRRLRVRQRSSPRPRSTTSEKTVDVTFQVERGTPVIVDRIEVDGQHQDARQGRPPRDAPAGAGAVLRRRKLRKSREALQRLGFFQEVNITTRRGAQPRTG